MKTAPDKYGTPIKRDLSGVEMLRAIRGVRLFDQMPLSTQKVYLQVAKCFPNTQVWAVGSRVRGDYKQKGDYFFVALAREAAGMKPKKESDFDFLVSPDAIQVGELPPNCEQVKCKIPENERIPIPIYKTNEI